MTQRLRKGATRTVFLLDCGVDQFRKNLVGIRQLFRTVSDQALCHTIIVSRINELLAGWMTALPVVCAFSFICVSASYHWWMFAFFLTFCWYFWKIILAPNWFIGYAADVKPMQKGELKDKLLHLLKELGHPTAGVFVADRPRSWRHGHAILARRPGQTRLILFNHVFKELNDEEVLAVAACAIGRINRWHNAARLAFFTALSGFFWYGFAWLSEKEFFYRALNIEPALAMPEGTVNPALLFIILLTIGPVVLYPAVFFFESFHFMYSQITGTSPNRASEVPLAIVATKNDIVSPRMEDKDVRRYLMENGQDGFVRVAESLFKNIRYFAVSSYGDDCMSAARPFWWIVSETDKELADAVPIEMR